MNKSWSSIMSMPARSAKAIASSFAAASRIASAGEGGGWSLGLIGLLLVGRGIRGGGGLPHRKLCASDGLAQFLRQPLPEGLQRGWRRECRGVGSVDEGLLKGRAGEQLIGGRRVRRVARRDGLSLDDDALVRADPCCCALLIYGLVEARGKLHDVERQGPRQAALGRFLTHGRKADGRVIPGTVASLGPRRPVLDRQQFVDVENRDHSGPRVGGRRGVGGDDPTLAAELRDMPDEGARPELVFKQIALFDHAAADCDRGARGQGIVALVADDKLSLPLERNEIGLPRDAIDLQPEARRRHCRVEDALPIAFEQRGQALDRDHDRAHQALDGHHLAENLRKARGERLKLIFQGDERVHWDSSGIQTLSRFDFSLPPIETLMPPGSQTVSASRASASSLARNGSALPWPAFSLALAST